MLIDAQLSVHILRQSKTFQVMWQKCFGSVSKPFYVARSLFTRHTAAKLADLAKQSRQVPETLQTERKKLAGCRLGQMDDPLE